jgi:hypothetical protein
MQSIDGRLERLRAQVEVPEAWTPEKGDTLLGRVTGWKRVTVTKNNQEHPCEVVTVVTPEGTERSFFTWHAQARYKLIAPKEALGDDRIGSSVPPESRLAREGDFVAINYRGKSVMPDGNEAASYSVGIDRPPAEGEEDDDVPF